MIGVLLMSMAASTVSLDADVRAVAALPGAPRVMSAAGVTRSDTPLLTIENASPFEGGTTRRLVIVGGLDGDVRSARAVVSALRWFKTHAPSSIRRRWAVSALPLADPDGHAGLQPFRFPPIKGFFDDAGQPESRYVWRWVTFQAPDLVMNMRAGAGPERDDLKTALAAEGASGLGAVPVVTVVARDESGADALRELVTGPSADAESPLHAAILKRVARDPLAIAQVLAKRYPETPAISYIPAVAWMNTLRLAARTGDRTLGDKVRQQTGPWVSGAKKVFGNQVTLTAIAGTAIFAELAKTEQDEAARALALEGARLAAPGRPMASRSTGRGGLTTCSWHH